MSWTAPSDLKAQVLRLWDRGALLRPLVAGEPNFPLRLTLKVPSAAELTERFDAVRAWVADLGRMPHVRIEWREVNHRVLGAQRLPQSAWVDTLESALALCGRRSEAARFRQMLDVTRSELPALLDWLGKRPLQAIDLAPHWPHLLAVVKWLAAHPRPGVYLRQVDITGVHSKFIEAHRAVLQELLDLVLPAEAVDSEQAGVARFCARYGFLDKPARIRFRVLDERIRLVNGATRPDVTLDAASFAKLAVPARRVFVTENETNFLAFPNADESLVVFGAGYGWEALAQASWLNRCTVHYWGDIDTHGFAILDQLRTRLEHVESFLMDRETLAAHEMLWGEEADQVRHDLPRLTPVECELFDALRDNRIRPNLRLEQERVGFQWLATALENLSEGPSVAVRASSGFLDSDLTTSSNT